MKGQRTEDRGQRTEDRGQRTEDRYLTFDFCLPISVFCLLAFATGCEDMSGRQMSLAGQVSKLSQEKMQLQKQIEQAKAENEQLRKQMQVLSGLPEQVKGENIYRLQKVKIGGYTNFYDKDKDGKKEMLIVYLQPIDQDGDIIKAAGAVEVQLWNLSKKQEQALLGQWQVEPSQLKKLWFTTLMTHYRLTFDVADKIDEFKDPLTLKVAFTDYLTGKVFKEQKVIKP